MSQDQETEALSPWHGGEAVSSCAEVRGRLREDLPAPGGEASGQMGGEPHAGEAERLDLLCIGIVMHASDKDLLVMLMTRERLFMSEF